MSCTLSLSAGGSRCLDTTWVSFVVAAAAAVGRFPPSRFVCLLKAT